MNAPCRFFCSILIVVPAGTSTLIFAQNRQMGGVGITIFSERNFRGQSATFREDVPNLDPLGVNDKASSLRVGRGEQWEVCEHADYGGRCVVVSGDEPDLGRNAWNDVISSLRRVGGGYPPPPPGGNDYIVLFDRPNYRGNPTNYNRAVAILPVTSRRTQSVTIGRGAWELCEGSRFTGRCVTLDASVPNLGIYNLNNRVASLRPVSGESNPPPTNDWYIVVFDRTNYRGTPTNYSGPETNINKRARSVTIGRGVWELCDGHNFTGRCIILDTSVPDLRNYNLRNRIESVRPTRQQPRR